MKNNRLLPLNNGFRAFLALEEKTPFKLNARARFALVHNMRKVAEAAFELQTVRDVLFKQHANGAESIQQGSPEAVAFLSELNPLMEAEANVQLESISYADLNLTENQIPFSILVEFDAFLTGEIPAGV